jgi:phospholipid transport system substrate-binding protein
MSMRMMHSASTVRETGRPFRAPASWPMSLASAAAVLVATVGASAAPLATAGSATDAIRHTSEAVIRVLSDEDLKKPARLEERRRQLVQIIGERFSYEEMSKRALGAHWNRLTDSDRQEFVSLFKRLLANTYVDKIEGFGKEQVQYVYERLEPGYAEVRTKILSNKGALPLDFRLVDQSGEWRVYDIVVDGISLVNNYRGQFTRILSVYSYPQLMAKLREKSRPAD